MAQGGAVADRSPIPAGDASRGISALLAELAAPDAALGGAWEEWLHAGASVGRFELVREIGRGGFGVVWEARDRELGRAVAFKAVRASERAAFREERLLREAEAAARLSHPNIVTLYDVGRSEHGPYLVLELLRGQTLERKPMPTGAREALRIATDIARALAHAHEQGVVHRDLKPANVVLCDDGRVKVLDFGLAHAFGRKGVGGGTPAYMAPEQWRGAPEDERTDVFALGVMLHQMLSGALPFSGKAAPGTPPLLDLPGLGELTSLVARMMATDPVERPRDGAEVLVALERIHAPSGEITPARVKKRWPMLAELQRRRVFRALVLSAVGVLAAALGLAWYFLGGRARPAISAIAVLPFVDMSPQKNQEYFSDGIAEQILNALAHVEGIHVAGRTSSFSFKGKNEDLRTIAERLNVGAVLEGSVRRDGARIRITAQLVSAADGYRLWSETYDREMKGVFDIDDEIARAVVAALKIKLLPGAKAAAGHRPATDVEAYRLFLLGRHFFNLYSEEGLKRAVEAEERAIAIDPKYAPAWATLALATYTLGDAFSDSLPAFAAASRRAQDAAEWAVRLEPEMADGHVARGYIRLSTWDWSGALEDLRQPLVLDTADGQWTYAQVLAALGRLPEALAALSRAAEIDPLSYTVWNSLGKMRNTAGQLDLARDALQRALELAPDSHPTRYHLATSWLLAGKPAQARKVLDAYGMTASRLLATAMVEHDQGHAKESRAALDAAIASNSQTFAFQIAEVYAWVGDRDRAFEWLDRAHAQYDSGMPMLKWSALLRSLRNDPRYFALLRRLKLPTN